MNTRHFKSYYVLSSLCILMMCACLTGCATLKQKFIRRSKKGKEQKEIFQKTEVIYPKNVRYNNSFTYWKAWQQELIDSIGKNNKKALGAADRALYNLRQMQELLLIKKQQELQPFVDELADIVESLEKVKISTPYQKKIINRLNHHLWDVQRKFDYEDMMADNWIQED